MIRHDAHLTKLSDTIDGTGLHGYIGHEQARAGNRHPVTNLEASQLTPSQPSHLGQALTCAESVHAAVRCRTLRIGRVQRRGAGRCYGGRRGGTSSGSGSPDGDRQGS